MIFRSRSSRTVGSAFSVSRTGTRAGSALIAVASCARAERSFLIVRPSSAWEILKPRTVRRLLGVVVCPLPVGLFGLDELRRDLTPLALHLLHGGIGHAPRWIPLHRRGADDPGRTRAACTGRSSPAASGEHGSATVSIERSRRVVTTAVWCPLSHRRRTAHPESRGHTDHPFSEQVGHGATGRSTVTSVKQRRCQSRYLPLR